MNIYQQGYVSIAAGAVQVEGFGTRWLNYSRPGDTINLGGNGYTIQAVNDNHLITLSAAYSGASLTAAKYSIDRAEVVESLAAAVIRISGEVDLYAGHTRLRFITVSPGQEATYISKLEDARAYIAAGYPTNSSPFVWVHAEAAATGATATQVADLIVYTAGLWSMVGSQIEGARQAAKMAIAQIGSIAAGEAILTIFKYTMDGIN